MSVLIYIVQRLVVVYMWLIIIRALLSWFPVRRGGLVARLQHYLFVLTEPYLRLLRRILPQARMGAVGLDLSAMVGVIILIVLNQALLRLW